MFTNKLGSHLAVESGTRVVTVKKEALFVLFCLQQLFLSLFFYMFSFMVITSRCKNVFSSYQQQQLNE